MNIISHSSNEKESDPHKHILGFYVERVCPDRLPGMGAKNEHEPRKFGKGSSKKTHNYVALMDLFASAMAITSRLCSKLTKPISPPVRRPKSSWCGRTRAAQTMEYGSTNASVSAKVQHSVPCILAPLALETDTLLPMTKRMREAIEDHRPSFAEERKLPSSHESLPVEIATTLRARQEIAGQRRTFSEFKTTTVGFVENSSSPCERDLLSCTSPRASSLLGSQTSIHAILTTVFETPTQRDGRAWWVHPGVSLPTSDTNFKLNRLN